MGKYESFAVYKIDYGFAVVYVSKNPDGRLSRQFSINMPLVEIKCVETNADFNLKSARRLACFTDVSMKKIEYQIKRINDRECFTQLKVSKISSHNNNFSIKI